MTKTSVDWLGFRCRNNHFSILENIRGAFGSAGDCLTMVTGLQPKDGWARAAELLIGGDIAIGRIDYEGDSQRGWNRVILTGEGCSWVQDWEKVAKWGENLIDAEIRRLDLALTTYAGEVSHFDVVAAHAAGEFQPEGAGRPPSMKTITSSDLRAGRTCYIGKRENAKFLRCYEKGFELLKDVKKRKDEITHIGGDRVEDIYRVEVEFKAVDKFIPWFAVLDRDAYFAGAYPFCARVLDQAELRVMDSVPSLKAQVTLDNALENCRVSYGAILRTALDAFDGDREAVLSRVLALTQSDALIRAGVLTVAHSM
jgi:phage replication initiation protein